MLTKAFLQFVSEEDGPTATEYAVMLSLIIIVALGAITLLGEKMSSIFRMDYEALNRFIQ